MQVVFDSELDVFCIEQWKVRLSINYVSCQNYVFKSNPLFSYKTNLNGPVTSVFYVNSDMGAKDISFHIYFWLWNVFFDHRNKFIYTISDLDEIVHIWNRRRIGCYFVKCVTFTELWHVIVAWIECVTNSVDTKWKTKRAKKHL